MGVSVFSMSLPSRPLTFQNQTMRAFIFDRKYDNIFYAWSQIDPRNQNIQRIKKKLNYLSFIKLFEVVHFLSVPLHNSDSMNGGKGVFSLFNIISKAIG